MYKQILFSILIMYSLTNIECTSKNQQNIKLTKLLTSAAILAASSNPTSIKQKHDNKVLITQGFSNDLSENSSDKLTSEK